MARIRSIKPETFTSETLAGCSVHARWTFAGLWCYVDDEGRGKANAGLIKAAVWPLDEDLTPKHVDGLLDELEASRLICRYEVDGKCYLHVVNFPEHQHPNRPVASKLPACTRRAHGGLSELAVSPPLKGIDGGAAALPAALEVKTGTEPVKTGRTSGKPAGQGSLTEDAVSPHGASTTKSPITPPTPLRNELGEGGGDVDGGEIPPTAGAGKPRQTKRDPVSSDSGNAGNVVAAYVEGAKEAGLEIPGQSLRNRVGKQARELLREGKQLDKLIVAAQHMGAVGWDDLARQVQRDAAGANGSPPGSGAAKKTNYSDEEYTSGW